MTTCVNGYNYADTIFIIHKTKESKRCTRVYWTCEKCRTEKKEEVTAVIWLKFQNQSAVLPFAVHSFKWVFFSSITLSGRPLPDMIRVKSILLWFHLVASTHQINTLPSSTSLVACSVARFFFNVICFRSRMPKMWWLMNYSLAHFWHASSQDIWSPVSSYREKNKNGNKE